MKLAILSDTHGLLRPEVAELLKTADAILHGGDINKPGIVEQLEQYAPPILFHFGKLIFRLLLRTK